MTTQFSTFFLFSSTHSNFNIFVKISSLFKKYHMIILLFKHEFDSTVEHCLWINVFCQNKFKFRSIIYLSIYLFIYLYSLVWESYRIHRRILTDVFVLCTGLKSNVFGFAESDGVSQCIDMEGEPIYQPICITFMLGIYLYVI